MKPLPETPELLEVARRVVWFKEPAEALADPVHFLAHVMTYGGIEDLRCLEGLVGPREYREALDNAPPGVFDARSWAYWHLRYGHHPAPPLPTRTGRFFTDPVASETGPAPDGAPSPPKTASAT